MYAHRTKTTIDSWEDFLSKFKDFLVHTQLVPDYNLEVSGQYVYTFLNGYSMGQLVQDLVEHKDMFIWKPVHSFYWPNTNMFSGDNSQYGLGGYEVCQKGNYEQTEH